MLSSIHTFAGANTDDEASAAGMSAAFTAATNLHLEAGQVFPATGNVLLPGLVPPTSGTTIGLGSLEDGATGTAIVFYYNSAGFHRLVRYNPANGGSETILLQWAGLNFSPTLLLQGGIIGELLVYLDADGEPRCLNLARAAAGGYTPAYLAAEPFALHLVKVPPVMSPVATRQVVSGGDPREQLRIIQGRAYQFSYRYHYIDGEVTEQSPYSNWIDVQEDPATTNLTSILVSIPGPIPLGVTTIDVLVREANSTVWQIADTLKRLNGNFPNAYRFYGQLVGGALTEAETTKLYQSCWPAQALTLARNRVFEANILEGYPTPEPAFTAQVVNVTTPPVLGSNATFHELSPYRVAVQFYDGLGRPGGCSTAQTVFIPKQDIANMMRRAIVVNFTTTGAAALNAEIPKWAASYQVLIARNDRTLYFLQGRAADVLGYLGHKTIINDDSGTVDEIDQFVDGTTQLHQKLRIDIGNWPATGQGYKWVAGSGDMVRYIQDEKEFVITGQYGDYLEHAWDGYPFAALDAQGNAQARIEIYTPNTTSGQIYYERGPRLPVMRLGNGANEQRSYAQTTVQLDGDCFLVPLAFGLINRDAGYEAPNRKEFMAATDKLLIESMVPPYRLAPVSSQRTIVHERQQKGIYDGFFGIRNQESVQVSSATEILADTANRTAENLLWLDMSYGGRFGTIIPRQLQQVRRNIIRFGNVVRQGTLLNGLGSFEPLSLYDKLPQENGDVVRLSVADQTQSDGTVLVVNQTQGTTSLYLGQQPIKTSPDSQLLAFTDQVVGGENTLRGGFGCLHPATVVAYAGMLFWWCQERRELVRYNKGLVPLGETYKFRRRLEELAHLYGPSVQVRGCFDPRRQEYWLTFRLNELFATTVIWSERRQAWADAISCQPTAGAGVNAELLTWDGPRLYRHPADAPVGTFFGVYTPPSLTFVAAQPGGGLAKTWQTINVRSQAPWRATQLTTPAGQTSRVLRPWMRFVQGMWRATIRRDENSLPDPIRGLHSGRILQSESLAVTLTCPVENPSPLVGATVDFFINSGQSPNQ